MLTGYYTMIMTTVPGSTEKGPRDVDSNMCEGAQTTFLGLEIQMRLESRYVFCLLFLFLLLMTFQIQRNYIKYNYNGG